MAAIEETETVHQRLKRVRSERGLSQRQLAAGTNGYLTAAYVSRLEDGSRSPSGHALMALAGPLDTTALYLLTGRAHECPFCQR